MQKLNNESISILKKLIPKYIPDIQSVKVNRNGTITCGKHRSIVKSMLFRETIDFDFLEITNLLKDKLNENSNSRVEYNGLVGECSEHLVRDNRNEIIAIFDVVDTVARLKKMIKRDESSNNRGQQQKQPKSVTVEKKTIVEKAPVELQSKKLYIQFANGILGIDSKEIANELLEKDFIDMSSFIKEHGRIVNRNF